jgi:hypothetical protein
MEYAGRLSCVAAATSTIMGRDVAKPNSWTNEP